MSLARSFVRITMAAVIRLLLSIPAAGVIAFTAYMAFIAADDLKTGLGVAFVQGLIGLGAYAGPAVTIGVANRGALGRSGNIVAAIVLAGVTGLCVWTNYHLNRDALSRSGSAVDAQRQKDAQGLQDDRARLVEVDAQLKEMRGRFAVTSSDVVLSADEALKTAQRIRAAECGSGDPRQRGPKCEAKERDEQQRIDALTRARENKAMTDRANSLQAEADALRKRIEQRPAVSAVHSRNELMGSVSLVVELVLAVMLAIPELFTKKRPMPALDRTEVPASKAEEAPVTPASPLIPVPAREKPRLVSSNHPASIISYTSDETERDPASTLAFVDLYRAYAQDAEAKNLPLLPPHEAAEQISALCERLGIPIEQREEKKQLVGIRFKAPPRIKRKAIGTTAG